MAKKKDKSNTVQEPNVVWIQKGNGPICKYAEDRFKKFEANILKSGYRVLTLSEINKYLDSKGLEMIEVVAEEPKEEFAEETQPLEENNE